MPPAETARIGQALYAVVMEAYVHGVSTRSVDELVEAMGADSGISKSEGSMANLYETSGTGPIAAINSGE